MEMPLRHGKFKVEENYEEALEWWAKQEEGIAILAHADMVILVSRIGDYRRRIKELEQQLEDEICIREVVGQQVVELRTALEHAKNLYAGLCESAIEHHTPSEYRVSGEVLAKLGEVLQQALKEEGE